MEGLGFGLTDLVEQFSENVALFGDFGEQFDEELKRSFDDIVECGPAVDDASPQPDQQSISSLCFQRAVSRRHDASWLEKREAELQRALKKWVSKVDTRPGTCSANKNWTTAFQYPELWNSLQTIWQVKLRLLW